MGIIVALTAVAAGIVQGVTGFGSGIVLMMVLPSLYALPQAAGVSSAICIFLNLTMVFTYYKHINFKKIIAPAILYLLVCSFAINFSTQVDQALLKKVFGVFLVLLAIYYLFINKNTKSEKLSLPVSIVCIVISGACDALFGIGGPLMVLYFMAQTSDTKEYLGTIQTFFMINCIYNTIFRMINGILGVSHLLIIGVGIVGIILGGLIANKIVDKLNPDVLKKLIYIMIAVSGIMNLI